MALKITDNDIKKVTQLLFQRIAQAATKKDQGPPEVRLQAIELHVHSLKTIIGGRTKKKKTKKPKKAKVDEGCDTASTGESTACAIE